MARAMRRGPSGRAGVGSHGPPGGPRGGGGDCLLGVGGLEEGQGAADWAGPLGAQVELVLWVVGGGGGSS